jgi:hypothetical protein
MNNLSRVIAFASLLVLSGCASSYTVNSDYDKGVNFRKYTSYRIVNDPTVKGDPIANSELNQKRISQALDAEMQARGYVRRDTDADLIIKAQTDVRDRQSTQNYNPGWGYWAWYGGNSQTRTYEQSRLIINFIDGQTNQLVWQGWATGEDKKSPKDREDAIRNQVYRIMKQYPHRAGGGVSNDTSSNR